MTRLRLEICVDTAEGLEIAAACGVDRIELCSALSIGGLTPSTGMMQMAARLDCPVRVMIRPRQGDFIYSEAELAMMLHDIDAAERFRMEGVVVGANLPSGPLDEHALGRLTGHAKAAGLKVTLHRSFDITPDPIQALRTAQALGIDSILTSGGAVDALQGVMTLKRLVDAIDATGDSNPIEVMAGVGVSAANAGTIIAHSGVFWVHGSCSRPRKSVSSEAERLGYVSPEHRRTDPDAINRLLAVLSALSGRQIDTGMSNG